MGFVQLSDDLPNWEWFDDKNTVYVYVRLLMEASWCERDYKDVHLKRGQLITTYPEISEKCGVTIRQARTILERLKSTGKAAVKTTPKFSIITMLEYDCNNVNGSLNDSQMTVKRQPTRQSNDSPTLYITNNQNIRQSNNQTNNALAREGGGFDKHENESFFEQFWKAYPKKTAKQQAFKAFMRLNPDKELLNVILTSLERQKKTVQWTKDNGQFIPYPATWLNGKRWEDDIPEVNSSGESTVNFSHNRSEKDWLKGFSS